MIEWFSGQADLVTVSTEYLASAYRHIAKQVCVIANCLSVRLWNETLVNPKEMDNGRLRIGIVGSKNHDQDFALAAGLIDEALLAHPHFELVFFGAVPACIKPNDRIGNMPADYMYERHPSRLASLRLDIALVPLTPSHFNRAKSNIKFLEFGFFGIPALYADLEPYQGSVEHGGAGFLCGPKPAKCRDALFALIEDADLRQRVGQTARGAVLAYWMPAGNADRWTDVYRQATEFFAARSKTAAIAAKYQGKRR